MKKRVLVYSWFFPPVNSSEGLATYKLLKSSQYSFDVFTQKSNNSWSYGNTDYLPETENIHPVYAKAKELDSWWMEGIEYYKKNSDKYDIVMTRAMPPESHKIGLEIKKINPRIKWIASFGAPISDNPYTILALPLESPYSRKVCRNILGVFSPKRILKNTVYHIKTVIPSKKLIKKEKRLQRDVIYHCDRIIFNNKYQKEYMLLPYGEGMGRKAVVLNHSFDPSLYSEKKEKNSVLTMTYVGHLDQIRTPKLFLEAVNELAQKDEDLASKFHVNFYGNLSESDKLYIINNELYNIVSVRKPVSYLESLRIMKNSDWLLQIDANITTVVPENIFFAAKLADYIGSGNPVFGITMLNGICADILHKLGAVCVSYSKNEILNYLWLIIYNHYTVDLNRDYSHEFSCDSVAKEFDTMVDTLNEKGE